MWPKPEIGSFAVRLPLILLAVIFVAESAVMIVIAVVEGDRPFGWIEVVVDSTVLTLMVAPLLYWFIVRPIRNLAEERSRLLAHVFAIQDAERQRIARDLHDEIGQSFASLLVNLRVLEEAATLQEARVQVQRIRELSSSLYDQVRGLARGLHPTVLDDLGLVDAVRRLAEDFEATHETSVMLDMSTLSNKRLDPRIERTAYRVVQESLTNCAKHAQATRVEIVILREERQLTVTIADNGQGFNVSKTMHAGTGATIGLTNMRERALLVQGSLTVRSRPGGGTTVTLRVPLEEASHVENPRSGG